MTSTQSLNLYNIAFKYFKNEADATSFVKEIEIVINEKVEIKGDVFEKIVSKDIENLRHEMNKSFASKEDLAHTKVDLIKWVFAFFVTLALMILGLYLKK